MSTNPDPRCPRCGFTMCQEFDERPITALAVSVTPNGSYRCYHCSGAATPPRAPWQPIATAPKKAETEDDLPPRILVLWNDDVYIARWTRDIWAGRVSLARDGVAVDEWGWQAEGLAFGLCEPTHWMRLPVSEAI